MDDDDETIHREKNKLNTYMQNYQILIANAEIIIIVFTRISMYRYIYLYIMFFFR